MHHRILVCLLALWWPLNTALPAFLSLVPALQRELDLRHIVLVFSSSVLHDRSTMFQIRKLQDTLSGQFVGLSCVPLVDGEENPAVWRNLLKASYFVLTTDDVTRRYLLNASEEDAFNDVNTWVVVESGEPDSTSFFSSMHVPFDSDIMWVASEAKAFRFYEVYRMKESSPLRQQPFGYWTLETGFNFTHLPVYERRSDLLNLTLKVATKEYQPYTKLEVAKNGSIVSARGFLFDVWELLQDTLKFQYTLYPSADGKWGGYKDGKWLGLIGMVHRNEADVAIAPLTETFDRSQAVHFTYPILITRFKIYIRRPSSQSSKWYFGKPFSRYLWLALLVQLLLVPPLFHLLLRVRYRQLKVLAEEDFHFTLDNCYLYILGAFCTQGAPESPNAWSARMIFWLILASGVLVYNSYAAALTSHLAVKTVKLPFQTIEELLGQRTFQLGTLKDSVISEYFESSKAGVAYHVWEELMKPHPENLMTLYGGYERAAKDRSFAFVGPEDDFDYREYFLCDLIQIKRQVFSGTDTIVFQLNSPYNKLFYYHLKKFEEVGLLMRLRKKYFQKLNDKDICEDATVSGVDLKRVSYLYLLYGAAIITATIFLSMEFGVGILCQRSKGRGKLSLLTRRSQCVDSAFLRQHASVVFPTEFSTGVQDSSLSKQRVRRTKAKVKQQEHKPPLFVVSEEEPTRPLQAAHTRQGHIGISNRQGYSS